jgi:hypothetical protein
LGDADGAIHVRCALLMDSVPVNRHAFGGVLVVDLDLLEEREQERGQALDTVLVTAKK